MAVPSAVDWAGVSEWRPQMAWSRELLSRFRPVGTPGAAARAAVPVDRPAESAAELEPVLAQLAEVESACAGIRAQALRDAEQTREQAQVQAARLVAEARAQAEAERADAVAAARAHADAESAHLTDQARRQAAACRELAGQRMAGYVDRVMAMVRAAGEDTAAGAGDAR
jgi:F0F1-type ATP synthase membrane subunit b/b'